MPFLPKRHSNDKPKIHTPKIMGVYHYDTAWRKFRKYVLANLPLCNDCGHGASEVHEIHKQRGKERDISNVMSLCKSCHSVRTSKGE